MNADKRVPGTSDSLQNPPPPPPSSDTNTLHPPSGGNPKSPSSASQRFHPYQRPGSTEKSDPRLLRRQNSDNTVKQLPTDPRQRGSAAQSPQPKPAQVNMSRDPRRR